MLSYNFKYIQFSYLRQNFGDETSFYKEIIQEAQSNIPEIIKQLNNDLRKKAWGDLGKTAHQLKGVVQIFGLEDLAQKLKTIQIDSEQETDVASFPPKVAYVTTLCEAVVKELKIAYDLL